MRDYISEALLDIIEARAADKELMRVFYKHFKDCMDDFLLDSMHGIRRAKREIRDLYDLVDATGFESSDCSARRYYALASVKEEKPLEALAIFYTLTAFPRGILRLGCAAGIIRAAMKDHVTYIKVVAALHASGEYGILEDHIQSLNSGLGDTYECLQIMLRWTLKTDDIRLFRQIRGSHYVSPAHARAEGAHEVAAMLEPSS
jgi:hypothetical protein